MEFYNVKLRKQVEVSEEDIEIVLMKNGKKAARATTKIEGNEYTMFRILSNKQVEELTSGCGCC